MDQNEEQEGELQALEAIFDQDFRIVDQATATSGARFEVDINEGAAGEIKLRLIFTHTMGYPDEPLVLVVHALEGLSTPMRKELQVHLEGVAKESAAAQMESAFAVCEAAREWLSNNVVGKARDEEDEEELSRKFETLDATQQDKVEVISSKAIGTPVTVESFAAWRGTFEAEQEALKSKEEREREANKKMTGRQMFESRVVVVSAESESFWEAEASQASAGD